MADRKRESNQIGDLASNGRDRNCQASRMQRQRRCDRHACACFFWWARWAVESSAGGIEPTEYSATS